MILVPHQDDDINLMGGVLEQYVKYGSDMYDVFSTNGYGDERYVMEKMGYVRMREAIKALIFLGMLGDDNESKNLIYCTISFV